MKTYRFVAVVAVLALGRPLGIAAQSPPQPDAKALLQQSAQFAAAEARLRAEKKALLAENEKLKGEGSSLKAAVLKLKGDKLEFKMKADELQQDIAKYNAKCGGSHPRSVYESLRPTCEPWSTRIDAQNSALDKTANNLKGTEKSITDRQSMLSMNTLDWTKRIKGNDAKISELTGRVQNWRVQMLTLKSELPGVEECARIPGIEKLMLNVLDGPAENAHRCLQHIFDGAKKRH